MKERMVPAQQLSDAGEDLVRLAAAKDAEIAALKLFCAKAAEVAVTTEKEIAALTEQRDRLIELGTQWRMERDQVTEQRDRAITMLRKVERVLYEDTAAPDEPRCGWGPLWVEVCAALDTPSSPSLPESPIDAP